jgi:probable HAF family extracellular repeat protein
MILVSASPVLATSFTFVTIEDPSAVNNGGAPPSTFAYGINDVGQIVGSYTNGTDQSGFFYSGGSYNSLNVPGDNYRTIATGINMTGEVVGTYYYGNGRVQPPNAGSSGFLYSNGSYSTFSDPTANGAPCCLGFTFAFGINNGGQIVGSYFTGNVSHGFIFSDNGYTTLDPPGSLSTGATGINDSGQTLGGYYSGAGNHGFLYSGGTYTTLDIPGPNGTSTEPFGMNNEGQIVGFFNAGDGTGVHGFLFSDGVYTTIDDPLATNGTEAYGINDNGQIVGTYFVGTVAYGFLATPEAIVPGPVVGGGLPGLICAGAGALACWWRRRLARATAPVDSVTAHP